MKHVHAHWQCNMHDTQCASAGSGSHCASLAMFAFISPYANARCEHLCRGSCSIQSGVRSSKLSSE